jgi:hypothetical protein
MPLRIGRPGTSASKLNDSRRDCAADLSHGVASPSLRERSSNRAHAHRDADADRLHVGLDELHRAVDRQAGVDRAAGRVDVEADVLPCSRIQEVERSRMNLERMRQGRPGLGRGVRADSSLTRLRVHRRPFEGGVVATKLHPTASINSGF